MVCLVLWFCVQRGRQPDAAWLFDAVPFRRHVPDVVDWLALRMAVPSREHVEPWGTLMGVKCSSVYVPAQALATPQLVTAWLVLVRANASGLVSCM